MFLFCIVLSRFIAPPSIAKDTKFATNNTKKYLLLCNHLKKSGVDKQGAARSAAPLGETYGSYCLIA
jgi:hypothetical protein